MVTGPVDALPTVPRESVIVAYTRSLRPAEGEVLSGERFGEIVHTLLTLQLRSLYHRDSPRATASLADVQLGYSYPFGKSFGRRSTTPYWHFSVAQPDGTMLQARTPQIGQPVIDIYLRRALVGQALLSQEQSTASLQLAIVPHDKEYDHFHLPILTRALERAIDIATLEEEQKLYVNGETNRLRTTVGKLLDNGGLVNLRLREDNQQITEIIAAEPFKSPDEYALYQQQSTENTRSSGGYDFWLVNYPHNTVNGAVEAAVLMQARILDEPDEQKRAHYREFIQTIVTAMVAQTQREFPTLTSGGKQQPMPKPSFVASQMLDMYMRQHSQKNG